VTVPDPPRPAREELREQLLQAARRQAAPRPARRRHRRRGLAVVAAVALGAAAAAGAAELIATGDPVPDTTYPGTRYGPAAEGVPVLDAKAPDPDGGLGWGVGVYTSEQGLPCAVGGRVRALSIGTVRDGTFHPYERGTTGVCGKLDRAALIYDLTFLDGVTIVFGRTREPGRRVIAEHAGESRPARSGRRGGFVWAFDGRIAHADISVRTG
jgi:hypothetical protein